jgi:hypothetical protein
MSRTTVFNITDLSNLEHIAVWPIGTPPATSSYLSRMLEHGVTCLNITLRWPLEAYRTLENAVVAKGVVKEEQVSQVLEAWARTGERLSKLESLAQLRLWFDHADLSIWALVNEKALLNPLIVQMSGKTVNIVVILLKLHPLHEHEDRHFLDNTLGGRIRLYRMLRQRWHSSKDDNGAVEVIYKPDFPFSIDVFDDKSIEEAEAWERQAW